MEDRTKHRIVGMAVIIATAALFAPFLFHRSWKLPISKKISFRAPPRPSKPRIQVVQMPKLDVSSSGMVEEYKPLNIAHVDLTKSVTQPRKVHMKAKRTAKPTLIRVAKKIIPVAASKPKAKIALKVNAKVIKKVKAPKVSKIRQAKLKRIKPVIKSRAKSWAVQVASFTTQKHADILIKRLNKKSIRAYSRRDKLKTNKIVYRVFTGRETSREAAALIRSKVLKLAKLKGIVVRYEA